VEGRRLSVPAPFHGLAAALWLLVCGPVLWGLLGGIGRGDGCAGGLVEVERTAACCGYAAERDQKGDCGADDGVEEFWGELWAHVAVLAMGLIGGVFRRRGGSAYQDLGSWSRLIAVEVVVWVFSHLRDHALDDVFRVGGLGVHVGPYEDSSSFDSRVFAQRLFGLWELGVELVDSHHEIECLSGDLC